MKTKKPYRTSGGKNCWFTPPHIIEAARAALGAIDLDPASCAEANKVVKAATFYTAEQDGLRKTWGGRVFLNPPYDRVSISRFTLKLVDAYNDGTVSAAIALVNNSTDTYWWQELLREAQAVCFIMGRVRFTLPRALKRKTTTPFQGSTAMYLGPNPFVFTHEFSALGLVRIHEMAA